MITTRLFVDSVVAVVAYMTAVTAMIATRPVQVRVYEVRAIIHNSLEGHETRHPLLPQTFFSFPPHGKMAGHLVAGPAENTTLYLSALTQLSFFHFDLKISVELL